MTHTPGPYEIVTADIGDEFACIVPVCITANGRTVISDNGGLAPDDEEWHAEELFANAHLFAAAPDMLAALLAVERAEQLSNVCEEGTSACEEWLEASNNAMEKVNAVLKRLRAAGVIEKAEGRTA